MTSVLSSLDASQSTCSSVSQPLQVYHTSGLTRSFSAVASIWMSVSGISLSSCVLRSEKVVFREARRTHSLHQIATDSPLGVLEQ